VTVEPGKVKPPFKSRATVANPTVQAVGTIGLEILLMERILMFEWVRVVLLDVGDHFTEVGPHVQVINSNEVLPATVIATRATRKNVASPAPV
jgi:hypothetical protein